MSDASLSDASRSHVLMSRYPQTYLPTLPTYSNPAGGYSRPRNSDAHDRPWIPRVMVEAAGPLSCLHVHPHCSQPAHACTSPKVDATSGGRKKKGRCNWLGKRVKCGVSIELHAVQRRNDRFDMTAFPAPHPRYSISIRLSCCG